MSVAEWKTKSKEELQQVLSKLEREQFRLNMARHSQNLTETHLLKKTRRDIARLKTIISEKIVEAA